MRLLIIFIFLLSNAIASEANGIKNLVINKNLKKYDSIIFLDAKNQEINLDDYQGKLILINFWATWCAPCKEEMPSLDNLSSNSYLNNLKIFPINIGQDNIEKSTVKIVFRHKPGTTVLKKPPRNNRPTNRCLHFL